MIRIGLVGCGFIGTVHGFALHQLADAGLDNEQPVGLGLLAGELGDVLRRGDADRRDQPGLVPDARPDGGGGLGTGPVESAGAGDVEERLVE